MKKKKINRGMHVSHPLKGPLVSLPATGGLCAIAITQRDLKRTRGGHKEILLAKWFKQA